MNMLYDTTTETLLATGASETATGSRLAMRGMIWLSFTAYRETMLGDVKPATMQTNIRAALAAAGRGKGECSTKASQAMAIAKEFGNLFAAELTSEYTSVQHFIQACFFAAEASDAGSVLRLVDWAKYGDANHAQKMKDEKKAEAEAKKAEAVEAMESAAQSATGLLSMGLDEPVIARAIATIDQSDNGQPMAAPDLSGLSDEALASLIDAAQAEQERRAALLADANAA